MNTHDLLLRGSNTGTALVKLTPESTPFLRYVWRLALRWKKTIGAIVVGCMLIGLVITLLMTPQYTATSTIEIARESDRIVDLRGAQKESTDADQEFYQTQYGLLKSRSLAERVATQLRLVDDRAFFEMYDVDTDNPAFNVGPSGQLGAAGRPQRLRVAGGLLLNGLDVSPIRSSRLVEISFESPDPSLSQKVANAWSTNFIEATLQRRYQANSYARDFLEKRIVQLRQRLEASERALVGYAEAQRIINLPGTGAGGGERSLTADDLTTLNTALAEATADRVKAKARYQASRGRGGQASEGLANSTINTLRAKRAELQGEYQKLMLQFEPGYPPARALKTQIDQLERNIGAEEGRISGAIELAYREALGREQGLKDRVEQLKSGSLDLRRRNIQYQILQRDADTNRGFYDALLARYKEIGIAGGVGVNNVSIVDPADLPQRPSSPRLVLNMLLALIIGCALGGIAAFLLEQADEAISDPTEVERMVGLPLLGSVPKLGAGIAPTDALTDRKSSMVDAYLAVQTNLSFSTENGVPRSVAVTSTRPSEGKSTTALALATTLARAQRRTVLIDGDMRSPSVHHLIGTDHRRGLSNFLAGEDEINPLLHDTAFGFQAITAGPIPPNAAELLTSDRLRQLVDRLLEQFDHVVIDSPPVMGLADAPLIGGRVDGVIYAVESHGIRSSQVRAALARLYSAHVRVLGAVLTKFETRRSTSGYEYGYGYGEAG